MNDQAFGRYDQDLRFGSNNIKSAFFLVKLLEDVGYEEYLTFEYFHPYLHYPEALIHQTSDSLDRMLGRKV